MKDTSGMYLVNLIAICALQSYCLGFILLYTCPTAGLPAVAMLKKHNKHNVKSAGLQLFDFPIYLLNVSLLFCTLGGRASVCAGAQTHRWSCLMTEFGWRRNCGNSLTVLSDYLCGSHIHTHAMAKEAIVTQTH